MIITSIVTNFCIVFVIYGIYKYTKKEENETNT